MHTVGGVRWIVDAMNVIGSRPDGWWKNRRNAMARLVDQLERWASAQGGHHVTVVFERPMSPAIESSVIEIAHAPKAAANSADDEIVRLVQADLPPSRPHGGDVGCRVGRSGPKRRRIGLSGGELPNLIEERP